jgi:anti-anti-sigma regulatory factor
LDAIIVNAAIGLFEFHEAYAFKNSNDKVAIWVWMIAFLATVFTGAFDGILIAVVMSLLLVLHHIVNPSIHVLGQAEGKGAGAKNKIWVNMQADGNDGAKKIPHVLVVRVAGPIFYANSERFQDYVHDLEVHEANDGNPISAIVLCATSVPFVDVTAMQIIEEMFESCKARGVKLYIAGAFGKTRRDLEKALADKLHQSELRGKSIEDCVEHALKDLGEWDKSLVDAAPVQAVADPFHHRALPQIQKTSASRLESGTIAKAATTDLTISGNQRDLARDKFFTDDCLYSVSENDVSKVLSTKNWAVRKPKPGSDLHTLYQPHEDASP